MENNNFAYTAEMALFEIWGAIQIAGSTYDIQIVARKAMERAGMLEAEANNEM